MESHLIATRLNSAQALHLLTSAQYVDKLFSDIEAVLRASQSKSPFRKYRDSLPPLQAKVTEDYLARLRAQLVQALKSQSVELPEPQLTAVHSIRTHLAFAKIAFQDCTPDRMRGYGSLEPARAREISGLVEEMIGSLDKLDSYLAGGPTENLAGRLERLGQRGGEAILKPLVRIIDDHGLVEFRTPLAMIIERLEAPSFEIALFGRVNSGKSSLLNAIVQSNILPVGVNPMTAVPTRVAYGATSGVKVWYADRRAERLPLERLADFVTEDRNPGNGKHVSRILVELPSPRLGEGIVFVDTPGLGSLAVAGAAETLAYLPCCDLGVVLVDAGSTITEDDLMTIRLLYEAGISVAVLLSKSDLLSAADQARASAYAHSQIITQLKLDLPVHPVSALPGRADMLENWFAGAILPLYERHQELARQSLRRKIGGLRQAVESALRVRLEHSTTAPSPSESDLSAVDARLREAAGRFEDARQLCAEIAEEIEGFASSGVAVAAIQLAQRWRQQPSASAGGAVRETLMEIVAARASFAAGALTDLARALTDILQDSARELRFTDSHDGDDLSAIVMGMPRLDLQAREVDLRPSLRLKLSLGMEGKRIERRLRAEIGDSVEAALKNYSKLLRRWSTDVLADLRLRFDSQADAYRAQLQRLGDNQGVSQVEEPALRRDLERLSKAESRACEGSSDW